MSKLYEVISEVLMDHICVDHECMACYEEPYRIYEVIEASSPGQAKYMAWKKDKSFTGNIRDMPKFSVKLYRRY